MDEILAQYRDALVGLKVSHAWRGHGSAIFLEFGDLRPRKRLNGSPGNPAGELGLMIEWSWRVENGQTIQGGSWSDDEVIELTLAELAGRSVTDLALFGELPELSLALSGKRTLKSFMTAEGSPQRALFDRRTAPEHWLRVEDGKLRKETSSDNDR